MILSIYGAELSIPQNTRSCIVTVEFSKTVLWSLMMVILINIVLGRELDKMWSFQSTSVTLLETAVTNTGGCQSLRAMIADFFGWKELPTLDSCWCPWQEDGWR